MSMLSLRPDDRNGLTPMERWSSSAMPWGYNPHQQVFDVLDVPANEMTASLLSYSHTDLQSQSMFARRAGHDSALVQAFLQAKAADPVSVAHNHTYTLEHSLLHSSNNNSIVESSTSDVEDCTAPEMRMNCISVLADGGSVMPDHQAGSRGTPMSITQEDIDRMHHPPQTRPCEGAVSSTVVTSGLKHTFDGDEYVGRMSSGKARGMFQGGFGGYGDAPSSAAVLGLRSTVTTYSARDAAPAVKPAVAKCYSASEGSVDMDSLSAIMFLQASQPVPSLEEMAKTRPKRRNVRISKDPQSVAARHRRERISDRMRVLQRLVPGGTKMDTASMLDEAIHYVKFLKLQLQALEQIGHNKLGGGDGQGESLSQAGAGEAAAQQLLSMAPRSSDLNCAAAFQAWQLSNSNNSNGRNVDYYNIPNTGLQAPPQARVHSNLEWA